MKKSISFLLAVSIGILFIISAVTKIYPIELFEFQFVDLGVASWSTTPYIARFFISIEFFLGMLLIVNLSLRKFTLRFAVALLLFFCIYLFYKIITEGNSGNCGCFGEIVKMSPLQGILKNIVLIIACGVCYSVSEVELWNKKWKISVVYILFIIALALGFFINPIQNTSSHIDKNTVNYRVPLELMYDSTQVEKPSVDLMHGKHIVAFLSLSCPHCKIAAKKLAIMHKKNPELPIYLALNGDKELLASFFEYSNAAALPHHLFLGPDKWVKVAGFTLPNIMYINNSIVEKKFNGVELNQDDIENWLKQ